MKLTEIWGLTCLKVGLCAEIYSNLFVLSLSLSLSLSVSAGFGCGKSANQGFFYYNITVG